MQTQGGHSLDNRAGRWIVLAFSTAMLAAASLAQLVRNRPPYAEAFAPDWLPFAAAGIAAAGTAPLNGRAEWFRIQRVLLWIGLLFMVCAANGLPIDLLRTVGLIPLGVDWAGLATRALALAAVVVLARLALALPTDPEPKRPAIWYGYAAFVLALPYPFFRTLWLVGGTLGLMWPDAAGGGFAPWLASIPWLLAAILSLLLVSSPHWMPRRLLLTAGWSATAAVAMVGPAACWTLVTTVVSGRGTGLEGIATWVPGVFYGSWFLWSIAAGAATRSYQLRNATP